MEIIQKFTSKNGFSKEVQQLDDYIFSTDKYILIRKKGKLKIEPTEIYSKANEEYIKSILKINSYKEITIDCKDLLNQLNVFKTRHKYDKTFNSCDTCQGNGEVVWEFESHTKEDDCPSCDGDGEVCVKSILLGLGFNDWECVKLFDDVFIRCDILYKLISVADSITFKETYENQVLFEFAEYDGIVMKYNSSHFENVKIDLTEK